MIVSNGSRTTGPSNAGLRTCAGRDQTRGTARTKTPVQCFPHLAVGLIRGGALLATLSLASLLTVQAHADQILLQDNFNRPDSTSLGAPWTQLNQVFGQYTTTVGQQIGPSYTGISSDALGFTYTTPSIRASNQFSGGNAQDAVFAPLSAPVSSAASVSLQYTPNADARSGYAIGLMNSGTGFVNQGAADNSIPTPNNGIALTLGRSSYAYNNSSLSITQFTNGTQTTLASEALPFQLNGGQTYNVNLSTSPNGKLTATVADGTQASSLSAVASGNLPTLNQFVIDNRGAGISYDTTGLTTQTARFDNVSVAEAQASTPLDFGFPLSGTSPAFLVTMAGGLSADSSAGTFCGITLARPTYIDPCHTSAEAYYALDFVDRGGTDRVVAAANGNVSYVHAVEEYKGGVAHYSPKIAINNGKMDGGVNDYYTIYQEFGLYDTAQEAIAAGEGYVSPGQTVSSGQEIGILSPGNGHLHFQLAYGCDTAGQGCSAESQPLGRAEIANRRIGDYALVGASSCTVDETTFTVNAGCAPSEAQYGSVVDPILPSNSGHAFSYEIQAGALGIGTNQFLYADPTIATGYVFQIDSGPLFSSVVLPQGQVDPFGIWLYDAALKKYEFDTVLQGGMPLNLGAGAARFMVTGIDPSEYLDPTNPSAFVTGLEFTGSGQVSFTQTPITSYVAPVPEPGAALLLLTWLAGLLLIQLRRGSRNTFSISERT